MAGKLAGSGRPLAIGAGLNSTAETLLDRLATKTAGPQQPRHIRPAINDRRFKPDRAGSGIEYDRNLVAKPRAHVLGRRRADPSRGIGAWRDDRPAGRLEEGKCNLMARHSDCDAGQAGTRQK